MGRERKPLSPRLWALLGGVAMAALPYGAFAETLIYKGENKWVAPDDNKPLAALQKAARDGKSYFKVSLPVEGRELAIARLEVVKDILAREGKGAVVMEEAGVAAKNTLVVE